jgi:hypothetical protein
MNHFHTPNRPLLPQPFLERMRAQLVSTARSLAPILDSSLSSCAPLSLTDYEILTKLRNPDFSVFMAAAESALSDSLTPRVFNAFWIHSIKHHLNTQPKIQSNSSFIRHFSKRMSDRLKLLGHDHFVRSDTWSFIRQAGGMTFYELFRPLCGRFISFIPNEKDGDYILYHCDPNERATLSARWRGFELALEHTALSSSIVPTPRTRSAL